MLSSIGSVETEGLLQAATEAENAANVSNDKVLDLKLIEPPYILCLKTDNV
jgi:hypothetical protein